MSSLEIMIRSQSEEKRKDWIRRLENEKRRIQGDPLLMMVLSNKFSLKCKYDSKMV
jgi:hypothetical protein